MTSTKRHTDVVTWRVMLASVLPKGAGSLFFIQIFSTLSFSVLYSTLVLYMTHRLGLDNSTANTITGFFLAFNYGLHLLGGFFGGRLLSNRALFGLGMCTQVLGCALIAIPTVTTLYWGLAAFLTGSGLNVTCVNCMLTQRFKPDDDRREAAFLWNYSGMNLGFFIGFSLSGYFQILGNYQQLFTVSALGNMMALLLLAWHWQGLGDLNTHLSQQTLKIRKKKNWQGFTLIMLMIPAMAMLVQRASFSNKLVAAVGLIMVGVLLTLAFQQRSREARQKMVAFVMLMCASLVFWTLYQIAPMGLTLFIKHNVDSRLWGYVIPPQWVANINTLVIVAGGPLLSVVFSRLRKRGIGINIPMQFAAALLLIGVGFAILPVGIAHAGSDGLTAFNWIIASYILQSLGELFISPIGYAMVGRLAPANLQGIMMGSWMMVSGVAATLSNYFSNKMVGVGHSSLALQTNDSFSSTFTLLGWSSIGASLLLLLLVPLLKRLIKGDDDTPPATSIERHVELA